MRRDAEVTNSNTNSPRTFSNGSSLSPLHKAALTNTTNGVSHSQTTSNGASSHSNGTLSTSRAASPTYFGHDREEVTRLLIQSLSDLGYNGAAGTLSRESGYELESPTVAAFRIAVLQGEWAEAEDLLFGSRTSGDSGGGVSISNGHSNQSEGLVLAEGADKDQMLFWMRQQKFLELLEERDLGNALMVLRQELTPLNQDVGKLHALSSLIMCQSAEDLKAQARWDGAEGQSRQKLLSELSRSISPFVMIPEHRLAVLLDLVKRNQIFDCLYHNTAKSPSLYSDHTCDPSLFPRSTLLELSQHSDEVWFLEFSHDGTMLATSSKDRTVIVYNTTSFEVLHRLSEHEGAVTYVAWSPDDSKLVSCAMDHRAKLWDMASGRCLVTTEPLAQPVTTAAWPPDGQTFVIGSLDIDAHLCVWDINGRHVYTWPGGYRVQDCAITPDGQRLITISTDKRIHVYNYRTREEEYNFELKVALTCISISEDSKYMLVNMADNEIQLLEIETADLVRRFVGQKQGQYVIRSNFGGAAENFVVSGSQDSRVYIWHKVNGMLVETLEGHRSGCVNAVAWNPRDPYMFASAGDDMKVRIWSNDRSSHSKARTSSNGSSRLSLLRPTFDAAASLT